jgi:diamine N-acetyltransferase
MHAVAYRTTGFSEIHLIRPLWEQLNEHHHQRASDFRSHYERWTFNDRKRYFSRLDETGKLRLDLAADTETGKDIGYCICSVSAENDGEVESLFIEPAYRSEGIGTALVTRGLAWMESLGTVQKRVSVGCGNEDACAFYRKFGFYPRMMVLEQKTGSD